MGKIFTLIAALLLSWVANAQISYKDIAPDYFQNSSGEKEFDFNSNLNSDLKFSLTILDPNYDVWFVLSTGDSTEVLADMSNSNFLRQLNKGDAIPVSGQWKSSENLAIAYLTSGSPEGVWPGSLNKYFAFRMRKNGGFQYGWMQMSVHNKVNNFTLLDYAYQSANDVPINAGEFGSTGVTVIIHEELFDAICVNRNLKLSFNNACLETVILDAQGNTCKRIPGNYKELNADLSALPEGMYFICVNTESGYGYRKILLQ